MKRKAKREGPLKITLAFDDAIRLALQVKPETPTKRKRVRRTRRVKPKA